MTTPMPVQLTCPCCGHKFESMSFRTTNTFGPLTTDLYRQAAGFSSLPLMVHGCDRCGYAGMVASFKPGRTTPALNEWVKASLGPQTDGFPAGAKYENAARIAEYLGARPYEAANIWLRAAWCESEERRPGERYRREAVLRFEAAMDSGRVPQEERALVTYLIGELYRRIGKNEKSEQWFARVPDAVAGDPDRQWLVDLAIQQSTDPKEFVDEGRSGQDTAGRSRRP